MCNRHVSMRSQGSRLITGEADKTIKIWKEDPDATAESHPVNYEPPRDRKRY